MHMRMSCRQMIKKKINTNERSGKEEAARGDGEKWPSGSLLKCFFHFRQFLMADNVYFNRKTAMVGSVGHVYYVRCVLHCDRVVCVCVCESGSVVVVVARIMPTYGSSDSWQSIRNYIRKSTRFSCFILHFFFFKFIRLTFCGMTKIWSVYLLLYHILCILRLAEEFEYLYVRSLFLMAVGARLENIIEWNWQRTKTASSVWNV